MDYEKKYKEALERAKDFFKANQKIGESEENDTLSDIFPELKESDDERIRKGLIKAVAGVLKGNTLFGTDITREEALAWLEKQGEQKPKWSEEDEELLQHCCGAVAAADYYTLEDKEEMENWLKSLKQRMGV